jgi:hypothetical protein
MTQRAKLIRRYRGMIWPQRQPNYLTPVLATKRGQKPGEVVAELIHNA